MLFRTEARRESRAVMGQDPYGSAAFAAMYLALHHPEAISKAAVQSYEDGVKTDLMAAASGEKHDLEVDLPLELLRLLRSVLPVLTLAEIPGT